MINHKPFTYEEWATDMFPKIDWNGRRWHNYGTSIKHGAYVEDWILGERFFVPSGDDTLWICISVDLRYIPIGNRNYSSEMWPEYVAMGAEKWRPPTLEQLGLNNPPAPLVD